MARFLGMVKVSADEAAKMVKDGPSARRNYWEYLVQEAGGSIEGMWLTNVGDWDVILVLDMHEGSTSDGAAATLARRAAGLAVSERWIELVDVDAAQSSIEALRASRPHQD